MNHDNSIASLIIRKSIGFVLFIILLLIAILLSYSVQNQVYSNTVGFFNDNVPLFFSIFLFGVINEIFWVLEFPFSILAPITSSILSVIVVTFLYRVWLFINLYAHSPIVIPITLIYTLVFIITLIFGYLKLAKEGFEYNNLMKVKWDKEKTNLEKELKKRRKEKVEWDDVEDQFKLFFYNLGDSINKSFERHRKRHERE